MLTLHKKIAFFVTIYSILISQISICHAASSYEIAKTLPVSDKFETEHFIFLLYDDLTKDDVFNVANGLEVNYNRIVNDLSPDYVPRTHVHLFGNNETWIKINPEMSGGGGTVTREHGTDNIWMFVYDDHEVAKMIERAKQELLDPEDFHSFIDLTTSVVHEFTHLVMVSVHEGIGNNPRWLWESVAVYEAGQIFDPTKNEFTLKNLNAPFSKLEKSFALYMFGYHISDYIIKEWGKSGLIQLIKTEGDTQQSLNISQEELETGFWDFINIKFFTDFIEEL